MATQTLHPNFDVSVSHKLDMPDELNLVAYTGGEEDTVSVDDENHVSCFRDFASATHRHGFQVITVPLGEITQLAITMKVLDGAPDPKSLQIYNGTTLAWDTITTGNGTGKITLSGTVDAGFGDYMPGNAIVIQTRTDAVDHLDNYYAELVITYTPAGGGTTTSPTTAAPTATTLAAITIAPTTVASTTGVPTTVEPITTPVPPPTTVEPATTTPISGECPVECYGCCDNYCFTLTALTCAENDCSGSYNLPRAAPEGFCAWTGTGGTDDCDATIWCEYGWWWLEVGVGPDTCKWRMLAEGVGDCPAGVYDKVPDACDCDPADATVTVVCCPTTTPLPEPTTAPTTPAPTTLAPTTVPPTTAASTTTPMGGECPETCITCCDNYCFALKVLTCGANNCSGSYNVLRVIPIDACIWSGVGGVQPCNAAIWCEDGWWWLQVGVGPDTCKWKMVAEGAGDCPEGVYDRVGDACGCDPADATVTVACCLTTTPLPEPTTAKPTTAAPTTAAATTERGTTEEPTTGPPVTTEEPTTPPLVTTLPPTTAPHVTTEEPTTRVPTTPPAVTTEAPGTTTPPGVCGPQIEGTIGAVVIEGTKTRPVISGTKVAPEIEGEMTPVVISGTVQCD